MEDRIDLALEFPIGVVEIEKILPHRYPFLLLDRWLAAEGGSAKSRVGRKVKALKNLTMNEPFFQGHFPGNPIMPGVLSLEALAQTAALCAYVPVGSEYEYEFYIVSADGVRFRKPIVPGDQLILEVELIKERKSMLLFDCKAYTDEDLATEAQIMAKVVVNKKN